jgi:hypothetical protein
VEAEIGVIYRERGLEAAFKHMEDNLLPLFRQREKVREKQLRSGRRVTG